MPVKPKRNNLVEDIKIAVSQGVKYIWLKGVGEPSFLKCNQKKTSGSSGATHYEISLRLDLLLKFRLDKKRRSREFKGYKILSNKLKRHLSPPLFDLKDLTKGKLDQSYFITVFHSNYKELSTLVKEYQLRKRKRDKEFILKLYGDFLSMMEKLWISTRSIGKKRRSFYNKIYLERINTKIDSLENEFVQRAKLNLSDNVMDLKFRIIDCRNTSILNEKKLDEIHTEIVHRIDLLKPSFSCMVHGDEHGKNILVKGNVSNQLKSESWFLIDYASVLEEGDWVFSIAKMLCWCLQQRILDEVDQHTSLNNYLDINKKNKIITLKVDKDLLDKKYSISSDLEGIIRSEAKNFASKFGDYDWENRLNIALPVLLFNYFLINTLNAVSPEEEHLAGITLYQSLTHLFNHK